MTRFFIFGRFRSACDGGNACFQPQEAHNKKAPHWRAGLFV
jgi:hypothetical protein